MHFATIWAVEPAQCGMSWCNVLVVSSEFRRSLGLASLEGLSANASLELHRLGPEATGENRHFRVLVWQRVQMYRAWLSRQCVSVCVWHECVLDGVLEYLERGLAGLPPQTR